MKQVTVVLMGMMLVMGMVWVPGSFAQIPGADLSLAITPALSECPGNFDYNATKCRETKTVAADTSAITPALSKCVGNFDYNASKCR